MSALIVYLYLKKSKTKVVIERVMVPMPMEDYQYDNDELYHEENQANNVQEQVQPGPEVSSPEVDDPYEDHNYSDENDSDDYESGPRGLGGHYYTYFDEDGRFVRTNTIHR